MEHMGGPNPCVKDLLIYSKHNSITTAEIYIYKDCLAIKENVASVQISEHYNAGNITTYCK